MKWTWLDVPLLLLCRRYVMESACWSTVQMAGTGQRRRVHWPVSSWTLTTAPFLGFRFESFPLFCCWSWLKVHIIDVTKGSTLYIVRSKCGFCRFCFCHLLVVSFVLCLVLVLFAPNASWVTVNTLSNLKACISLCVCVLIYFMWTLLEGLISRWL